MGEHATNSLHDSSIHPFCNPVLLWSPWDGEVSGNAFLLAKIIEFIRTKLKVIVCP